MSALLESALTDAQREACARNDAALIASFSEAELIEADLAYLARQQARERQQISEVTQLELDALRRQGLL